MPKIKKKTKANKMRKLLIVCMKFTWNICSELEAIISKEGMEKNFGVQTFFFFNWRTEDSNCSGNNKKKSVLLVNKHWEQKNPSSKWQWQLEMRQEEIAELPITLQQPLERKSRSATQIKYPISQYDFGVKLY